MILPPPDAPVNGHGYQMKTYIWSMETVPHKMYMNRYNAADTDINQEHSMNAKQDMFFHCT